MRREVQKEIFMKKTMAFVLLVLVILAGHQNVLAAESSIPSVKHTDPMKQLDAEIEMAMVYVKEMTHCINKLNKSSKPENPEELEQMIRSELPDALAGFTAEAGGNRALALERMRDGFLSVINHTAAVAATNFRLGVPEPVTVKSLRAAINDEKMRAVPICSGTPSFRGTVSGDQYASPRNWFRVQVPKSSNFHSVPFSIKGDSLNTPDANYDLVTFSVKDFGELLIAGVDYFPDDFIEKKMKPDDHRTVLSKLANMALHNARPGQGFRIKPTVVEEKYLNTPYGEALLRVYMAEKGSLLVQIKSGGGKPPVADTFDTLIAVIVAMQKNNFIYAIAENDDEGDGTDRNKEALKKRVQLFFASIAVHR